MTVKTRSAARVRDSGPDRPLRFRDAVSGCVFLLGTPHGQPALWRRVVHGAVRTYRQVGAEDAFPYEEVADGRSTSMFVAGVCPAGRVVAGGRMQGPYRVPDEAHAAQVWRGRDGEAALRETIAERIGEGVVEVKSGWVARDAEHRSALGAALGRAIVHMATLLGTRFVLGSADRARTGRWCGSGARVDARIPSSPYPDERYDTVVLWWDMTSWREVADAGQVTLVDAEQTVWGLGAGGSGVREG
ncbi:hypothetical protein ACTWP5_20855 [Streptomyces sp. 4N509B]|uniref:hypothetical protein n=1 Tax=Streptomyces sp. 4N509B TaxID=3457413 RepID=UPI003FD58CCD